HRHRPYLYSFPTRRSSDLLLVVALGQSYAPALLAISQCPPYRSGSRCKHGGALSFWRNAFLGRISFARCRALRNRADDASYFLQDRKSTRLNSSHVSISYA